MSDTSKSAALSDRVRSLRLGSRTASAPSRARFLPWLVSFVLLLTTLAFGYRAYRVGTLTGTPQASSETVEEARTREANPTPTTGVAITGEVVLESKGYVIPISLVQVSPKVGGQLVYIDERFAEGRKFKAGAVLARIEKVEFESEYEQARFAHQMAKTRYEELKKTMPDEIRQARYELEEAQKTTTQLKLEMERNRRLFTTSAVAQRDMEQARYAFESTAARVKKLEAGLQLLEKGRYELRVEAARLEMEQANAAMKKAKWRFDNTEVVAPISGTILTKKAELGNIVNPSAFSSGISASLCEMADLTKLEIDLAVQERDIANVQVGQKCQVMPEAYQADKEFLAKHPQGYRGTVSRLMPTADRAKGAIPVRVLIDPGEISEEEAGKYLRPDMGTLVAFQRMTKGSPGEQVKK